MIETQLTQKDSEKLTTILTRFRYALFSALAFDPRALRVEYHAYDQSPLALLCALRSVFRPTVTLFDNRRRSLVFADFQFFPARIPITSFRTFHFPLLSCLPSFIRRLFLSIDVLRPTPYRCWTAHATVDRTYVPAHHRHATWSTNKSVPRCQRKTRT